MERRVVACGVSDGESGGMVAPRGGGAFVTSRGAGREVWLARRDVLDSPALVAIEALTSPAARALVQGPRVDVRIPPQELV
jgi:hypothetical protein